MKPVLFALLAVLGHPAMAQDARALLAEAEAIALPLTDLNDWARAAERIVGEWAALGEMEQALALRNAAPHPSVLGSLDVAMVKGAIDGQGLAVAAGLADAIADPGIRSLAQADIVEALARAGDPAGALAGLARMEPGGIAVSYAVDDIVRALVAAGDLQGAEDFAAGLSDPAQAEAAGFWLAVAALERGAPDEALAIMGRLPPGPERRMLAMRVAEALARAGRWPEAEVLLLAMEDPGQRDQAVTRLALVQAEQGDLAGATARIATITDSYGRSIADGELAVFLARTGNLPAALDRIAGMGEPSERSITLGSVVHVLAETGQIDDALSLAREMTDEWRSDAAISNVIGILIRDGDTAGALALLPEVTVPSRRLPVLTGLVAAGADDAGALLAESLDLARAIEDPSDRARALVAIAGALREAEN